MGYTDQVSHRPGDRVRLHVSTPADRWSAQLVRLHALEIPSIGVKRRITRIANATSVSAEGITQPTGVGSFASVAGFPGVGKDGLTIAFAMLPMTPGVADLGEQTMMAFATDAGGWAIGIDELGHPTLTVQLGDTTQTARTSEPVAAGQWVEVVVRIPKHRGYAEIRVDQTGTIFSNRYIAQPVAPLCAQVEIRSPQPSTEGVLLWGCRRLEADRFPRSSFDGRIENPVIVADSAAFGTRATLVDHQALIAFWDLSADITPNGVTDASRIIDRGPKGRHASVHQHPHRMITSSQWEGDIYDARFAPEQYAAIHFHRDDITDCGWQTQAELKLPEDLPSGVYAAQVSDSAGTEDLVPIFVTPRNGATAPLLLIIPTNSYLAYANDHVGIDSPRTQVWSQMVPTLDEFETFRNAQRDIGLSLYEVHADGTPVIYSSWRRPILTMRERVYDHNAPVWQFTGDMQIVDWLERTGRKFDVATDRDVHVGGHDLLAQYGAVMTGTHPEYATREMLDHYEQYTQHGGRMIYMGGNGMYWVTGYDPNDEQVIEIRRWGGTQAWTAAPGEYHLSFTGELGGTWRFRGRPPQKTFGVGFVAAGNRGASGGYRRTSYDARISWVFDDVTIDDGNFGDYGVVHGAAGLEIDSIDPALGTSPEAIVLATSVGHSDDMLEARENFNMTSRILGGSRNPRVRSDIVLIPRVGGGAVFSTGSIAFAGALHNMGEQTSISTLLGNIVDRFISDQPVLDIEQVR